MIIIGTFLGDVPGETTAAQEAQAAAADTWHSPYSWLQTIGLNLNNYYHTPIGNSGVSLADVVDTLKDPNHAAAILSGDPVVGAISYLAEDEDPFHSGSETSNNSGKVPGGTNNPYTLGLIGGNSAGVSADGTIANSGESPFQSAGFGSEYDFAYNMLHKLAQENNEWSAAQAQAQMDFQSRMSSSAHQREVADLQAAGLNPVLSAGGSGASTPSGAMGNTDTSVTNTVAQLALHAIDGLANTAQGMASFHGGDSLPENASPWQRLEYFYTNSKLGHQIINTALSAMSRLPYAALRLGRYR